MTDALEKSTCTERGALVVTALVIMVALLVLGSLTTMIVVAERNISRNHKMAKEVFYLTDGGYPVAVKVIEDITYGEKRAYPGLTIDENLDNEVMEYYPGETSLNDKERDSPGESPDIKTTVLQQSLRIDIDRIHSTLLCGGSAEFASGGEGIGYGGGASKKVLFQIHSQGRVKNWALSSVKQIRSITTSGSILRISRPNSPARSAWPRSILTC